MAELKLPQLGFGTWNLSKKDAKAAVLKAIEIINEHGSQRGANGIPVFLPGLNFLGGLKDETPATYELNYQFLESVVAKGLLLRRINIRQTASTRAEFMVGPMEIHWSPNSEPSLSFLYWSQESRRGLRADCPLDKRIVPQKDKTMMPIIRFIPILDSYLKRYIPRYSVFHEPSHNSPDHVILKQTPVSTFCALADLSHSF